MQKIWLIVQNQSTFVYVIAGLCIVGVLSKLLLQGKLRRLLRESENMAYTKDRQLRTIRNHYENNLNMDLQIHHIEAFARRYILKLKYGGLPIRVWDLAALEAVILSLAAGGVGMINAIHQDYGEQVIGELIIAVLVSGAVLLSMENLFRLEVFYERLEANIEDYLDNNLRNRIGKPLISRQERMQKKKDQLSAVASEITAVNTYEDIPEYEIRRRASRSFGKQFAQQKPEKQLETEQAAAPTAGHSIEEVAAGEEEHDEHDAAVVAEVLRNFFSG